jgi:hypothetical protein
VHVTQFEIKMNHEYRAVCFKTFVLNFVIEKVFKNSAIAALPNNYREFLTNKRKKGTYCTCQNQTLELERILCKIF